MMSTVHAQRRDTAVQEVIRYIQERIQKQSLIEGDRLPSEAEISSEVGVSRTPVREAVKILEAIGVLEIKRGVGTYLRPQASSALGHLLVFQAGMANATPQHLYETRFMVERTAAELAAERRTDAHLLAMRSINEHMKALLLKTPIDFDEVAKADVAFHHSVFEACGNELIANTGKFIVSLSAPWMLEGHRRRGGGMESVKNHEMVISMIEMKNVGGAREAAFSRPIHDGLANWKQTLEQCPPKTNNSKTLKENAS